MKNVNASRIKRLRESRNISQEKLAEKIGISICNKMKLNIHAGASFVIARRGMNIKDAV